jgi:putative addiction module component (TIGR02574 family)
MTVKDLESQALSLSAKDRARLAKALLLSLDEETDTDAEKLWLDEAERRYRAYKQGKTKAKPIHQVLREARAKIR